MKAKLASTAATVSQPRFQALSPVRLNHRQKATAVSAANGQYRIARRSATTTLLPGSASRRRGGTVAQFR